MCSFLLGRRHELAYTEEGEIVRVLVFGSANIDRCYSVDEIVAPGETISSSGLSFNCGGKGFNQAIALARAGQPVSFAGAIGPDGAPLLEMLESEGIDASATLFKEELCGHAVIQVTPDGRNSIIVHSGANGLVSTQDVDSVLDACVSGDWIVLQNEMSSLEHLIERAASIGMRIAFNPSPLDATALRIDLSRVDYLLINEAEGAGLSERADPHEILETLHGRYPKLAIVLTLGKDGGLFLRPEGRVFSFGSLPVKAVDTTAAGDTFTGYFLAEVISGASDERALEMARTASALAVTRHGAADSIPRRYEVEEHLKGEPR